MASNLLLFLILAPLVSATQIEDGADPRSGFPRLYHVDDPARCRADPGAVYCYGVFALTAPRPHRLMDQLREHSSRSVVHFNRTLIYRGLCLSRCGEPSAAAAPAPERFASCVSDWTERRYQLQAVPQQIYYCRGDSAKPPLDTGAWAFVFLTAAILAANAAGTLYDLLWSDGNEAGWRKFLSAWSVRRSWRRLCYSAPRKMPLAPAAPRDPALLDLTTVQHFRALLTVIIVVSHVILLNGTGNIQNGLGAEELMITPRSGMLLQAFPLLQVFVAVSVLQTAHQLLLAAARRPLSPPALRQRLLLRLIRITPFYYYMVFWGATWWGRVDSDPLGARTVAEEQAACRDNLLAHVLYINNVVNPAQTCIAPTWFLALIFQMFLVTLGLLPLVLRRASRLRPLVALLAGSVALNFVISYVTESKSMVYLSGFTDVFNHHFGNPSLKYMYLPPTGGVPSALMGIILAICLHQPDTRVALAKGKITKALVYLAVPMFFCFAALGDVARRVSHPLWVALVTALDRPLVVALSCFVVYGLLHDYQDPFSRLLSWRGWAVVSRTGLACVLVHWPIVHHRVATGSTLVNFDIGLLTLIPESAVVWTLTLLVAWPCTLLLETPARVFLEACLMSLIPAHANGDQAKAKAEDKDMKGLDAKMNGQMEAKELQEDMNNGLRKETREKVAQNEADADTLRHRARSIVRLLSKNKLL